MNNIQDILQRLEDKYQYNETIKSNDQAWKRRKIITIVLCLITDVVILCLMQNIKNLNAYDDANSIFSIFYMLGAAFIIIISNLIILAIVYYRKNTNFQKVKTEFVTEFLEGLCVNIKYLHEEGIDKETYMKVNYQEQVDRYFSNNLIKINNGKLLEITEVQTKIIQTDGDKITEFEGLFSKSKLDKNINTELRIMCNESNYYDEKTKIDILSSHFENKFDVYSTNKIVAMQILTPDVIEKIIEQYNRFDYLFDITIIEDNIYIRVHWSNVFEFDEYDREKMLSLGKTIKNILILKDNINKIINDIEIEQKEK